MGLGKLLGAVGKTNLYDVSKDLMGGYVKSKEMAREVRRQDLMDSLRMREDKRAEEVHARALEDHDRKTSIVNLNELAKQVDSPQLAQEMLKHARLSGLAIDENDNAYRNEIGPWYQKFLEESATKGSKLLQMTIQDYGKKIMDKREQLSQLQEPKPGSAQEIPYNALKKEIARLEQLRTDAIRSRPDVLKAEEEAKIKEKFAKKELDALEDARREKTEAETEKIKFEVEYMKKTGKKPGTVKTAGDGDKEKKVSPDKVLKSVISAMVGSGRFQTITDAEKNMLADIKDFTSLRKETDEDTANAAREIFDIMMKKKEDSPDQPDEFLALESVEEYMMKSQGVKKIAPPEGMSEADAQSILAQIEDAVQRGADPEAIIAELKKQGWKVD